MSFTYMMVANIIKIQKIEVCSDFIPWSVAYHPEPAGLN